MLRNILLNIELINNQFIFKIINYIYKNNEKYIIINS